MTTYIRMAYDIFAFFLGGSAFYSCLFLTNRTWGMGLFWPVCITWPAIPSVYAAVKSPHSLMLFLYSASQGISVRVWLQNSPVLTLCFNCTFIQTVILLQQRVSFSRDNQLPSWIHILHIYLFNLHVSEVSSLYFFSGLLCTHDICCMSVPRIEDRRFCTLNFFSYIQKTTCWHCVGCR